MCNPETWTARYLHVLTNRLGWDARAEDDHIVITSNGLTMAIANTAPEDPEFLRFFLSFNLPEDVERAALLKLAGETTLLMKGTQVALSNESVVYTVEQVAASADSLPSSDHLVAVLPRLRHMLMSAVAHFHEELTRVRQDQDEKSQLAGIEAATANLLREDDAA